MIDSSTNTHVITNPQEAVEQFFGEQFIEWAADYITHQMKSTPELAQISSGQFKPEKIKKFMLQRFLGAEAFLGSREGDPGFLRFAIANLSESDDPTAESALEILEKRRVDELAGHKIEKGVIQSASRELWVRLLRALGATDEELERAEPKEPTRNYIAELSDVLSNSEWQTAAGVFAAYERSVPEEYRAIHQMLKNNTQLTEKDLEILTVTPSINHVLDKVVFDAEAKELVWEGIRRQLEIRQEFLTGLTKYLKD